MRNKWFGNDKQEELNANGNGNSNGVNAPVQTPAPPVHRAPQASRPAEKPVTSVLVE